MRIEITLTRVFEMNEQRVLSESGFEPPPVTATAAEKRSWLHESFYELCGFERDQDHVDGSYVRKVDEYGESEFDWTGDLERRSPAEKETR
jgi:hypothetical protein